MKKSNRHMRQEIHHRQPNKLAILALAAFALVISGCSATPSGDSGDRFETANRKVFAFNMGVDTLVLEPTAQIYRGMVPQTARTAVNNQLKWVSHPSTVLNSTVQGDFENAALATLHFLVNGLTLGLI